MNAVPAYFYSPPLYAPLHVFVLLWIVAVAPRGWHWFVKIFFFHLRQKRLVLQQQFSSRAVILVEARSS